HSAPTCGNLVTDVIDRMCPMCDAPTPSGHAPSAACPGCGVRPSTAPAIARSETGGSALCGLQCRALEPPPPRAAGWLFGPLFGGFLAALVLLGISHAAAFAVWAVASAATVGIGVWHARQSGRPALPSATAALRRDRPRRALPPPT